MAEATMKRGERTRLVMEFLQKNPKATKKEVMEKFNVSDATFYNTRKKLQYQSKGVVEKFEGVSMDKIAANLKKRKAKEAAKRSRKNKKATRVKAPKGGAVQMTLSLNDIPIRFELTSEHPELADTITPLGTLSVSRDGLCYTPSGKTSEVGFFQSKGTKGMVTWANLASLFDAISACKS